MGDRYDQQLIIGGKLPEAYVEALLDTARAEGLELQFGLGPWPMSAAALKLRLEELATELGDSPDNKGQLWLEAEQVGYGFDATEEFCRDHGLTYYRFCDPKYEYDADIMVYRPEWPEGEREVMGSTYEDEPAMKLSELKKQLSFGKTLEQVVAELELFDLSSIPPFEIISDVPATLATEPEKKEAAK